ncbi:MAG: CGLD27 family protein [Cyanobium sp.]
MNPRDAWGAATPIPAGESAACPVPPEQRPQCEYEQLLQSWFFAWPAGSAGSLTKPLLSAWLLALLPSLLVASGSYALRHHSLPLIVAAGVVALLLPMLLLIRQWLGWTYVRRRLVSERVEYEESGWYDGQVWEKPLAWRQRDLLIARHELGPVLQRLRTALLLIAALMAGGSGLLLTGLWQAL